MGTSKQGTPRMQYENDRTILTKVLVFLLYSYHVLGVPCLGPPCYSV